MNCSHRRKSKSRSRIVEGIVMSSAECAARRLRGQALSALFRNIYRHRNPGARSGGNAGGDFLAVPVHRFALSGLPVARDRARAAPARRESQSHRILVGRRGCGEGTARCDGKARHRARRRSEGRVSGAAPGDHRPSATVSIICTPTSPPPPPPWLGWRQSSAGFRTRSLHTRRTFFTKKSIQPICAANCATPPA